MTDVNDYISDEMLAAYIDGTSTRLENMIIDQNLNNEDFQEAIELSADYNDFNAINSVESIDISKTIDDYLKPFEDYRDLIDDVDTGSKDVVL